jgi:hypothetical protein
MSAPVRTLLNLFFIGLFGLVLPFICWGVQATPGHPHARAHFVFLAPEEHVHGSAPHDHGAAALPPGKATPSLLAISILLLVVLAAIWPTRADAPGFPRALPLPAARCVVLRQELPPPRRS